MGWKVVVDVPISPGVVAGVEMEELPCWWSFRVVPRYGLAPERVWLKHSLDAHFGSIWKIRPNFLSRKLEM